MTVMPLPLPAPAGPGSVPAPMGPDAEASAETFAALVTQLLSGQGTLQAAEVPVVAAPVPGAQPPLAQVEGEGDAEGAPATGDGDADPGGQAAAQPTVVPAPSTLPLVTGYLAVLPVATAPVTDTAPGTTEPAPDSGVGAITAVGDAPAPAARPAPAGPVASATTATVTALPGPTATAATAATETPAATTPQTPAAATSVAVAGTTDPLAGTPAPAAPGRQQEAPSDDVLPTAPATGASATTGVTPPSGAESVAGPSRLAADPQPAPAAAVTRQVFPEVTRLVAAGNGTHRVRLQLEPEALGDVRVVLTVRNGEVHVRLSAGEDAQRALREGAPELRRLLELAGASDTRIVVRDLSSGSAPGNGTNSNLTSQGGDGSGRGFSGDVGNGGDRSHHQHAGTRGGSNAREGINDGAVPHRHVQPATRTHSGVDVSM